MTERESVRIAVQRSGRLSDKSLDLLARCGFDFENGKQRLTWRASDFPVEVMLIRHDDIPEYVIDGVCDLGIVGTNALEEGLLRRGSNTDGEREPSARIVRQLGFGRCGLSIAVPEGKPYDGPADLAGQRIATSYPRLLSRWLADQGVEAEAVTIRGSVELAPALGIGDAICDLVASGQTLASNGLRETERILECESVLVRTSRPLPEHREATLQRILQRVHGVLEAKQRKYLMMHAPGSALAEIRTLFPGMEEPTILPLGGGTDRFAVHAVTGENVFWETMERLKALGASSILVMPIEKVVD